ncbi:DUF3427 domain-containing protein [Methanomassiliicoccaceae archaeon DOK]|nr:DUF3427 domain-containing protein [Methanomassiliicoccaceae archaeon DOK]
MKVLSDESLRLGLEHGFIDSSVSASEEFKPQLITNNPLRKEKVITTLKQEMEKCDEFMFSVAFVNSGGVNALAQEFRELDRKGIKGRIIASQYQNFTEPRALKDLRKNKNIDLRVITEKVSKMHTKCYIFRHGDSYDVIIGSSNLTNSALCDNMEWNLKFNSKNSGEIIANILSEFERNYEIATPVDDLWIEEYSLIYNDLKHFRQALKTGIPAIPKADQKRIQPNRMQAEALKGLEEIRAKGEDRALVISATGSGKTYLSAFDAKIASKKFLYIVHRNPILNKSMQSFEAVMEGTKTIAKYDPVLNDLTADCTFVTIQTITKEDVLAKIPKDWFDYILIDEVHHAGAPTYQRVINYFKPKFLLGMTATPDRTDDYDIYKLFNYNIAYDIRLKEAMEYKLICPFHYFGISDLTFDQVSEDDKTKFLKTEMDQRIDHILENAEYFGYCGDRLKGLVFCRDLKEAEDYSREFNRHGYKTEWVSGMMDKNLVETCIERLEADEGTNLLDYIFTADLFNEGVDIPAINQVIMLRPTESPIIFIQQLGRGLRHHPGKEYVVILDFIGNYEKNYNIPLALSDDRSYNKSEARRFIAAGDSIIPGNSTISFDEISRNKIYESIDNSDFTEAKIIMDGYKSLKMRLGRIPELTDFKKYGSIDALNLLSKYKSYHNFLKTKDNQYSISFDSDKEEYLDFITKIAAAGKRRLEVEALELLMNGTIDLESDLRSIGVETSNKNLIQVLDGSFYTSNVVLVESCEGKYHASNKFRMMMNDAAFSEHVIQIIELGRSNWTELYSNTYEGTDLVLNMRYTYEDVCRFLNWPKNLNAQNMGGYFYHKETKTFPVFINYVKGEDVVESQKYEDRFENRNTLIALSKSNDNRNSARMKVVENSMANEVGIHLFVRKNKNDKGSKEFYYLGKMMFVQFIDNNKPVQIEYKLKNDVRQDLYDYFNSE